MPKKSNHKYKRIKKKRSILKFIFKVFLVFFIISIPVVFVAFFNITKNLPDPTTISTNEKIESTKIYDRTGKILLYNIYGEEKRTIVSSEKINQFLKDATLAAEDDEFYLHKGIDFKSILSALIDDIRNPGQIRGGSTITQQLVKNSFLTSEKTLTRKIKEALLSLKLEKSYTKDEILTFYLNQIPYGSNAYGIESAAITFFNKSASDLSLAESALLASLPKAPSTFSPYGKHKDRLLERKDYILNRMYDIGYITKEQLDSAKNEVLNFSKESKSIKAPHFVAYIREYLENKYGYKYLQRAGLKIYTTLDYDIQKLAEKTISESIDILDKYEASNAALVVIDSKTGQVLAMVGSLNYFDVENEGNFNVTTAKRQPGSSFKPFAYAKLLEKGFTPETVLFDVETEFSLLKDPKKSYKPQNYDGRFRGPVTLKRALAQSLNVPAVKTLYLAGIDDVLKLVKNMGINTINDRSRIGLSLVLGGAEVKPLEMASAYSVFSNNGIKNPLASIIKITGPKGNVLEEWKSEPVKVLDENIAKTITSILSDNSLRAPVFGVNNYLNFKNIDVAAKTGTTQEFKDAWVVGYTTNVSVAVWVGNNDHTSLKDGAAGSLVAGPIFNRFINDLSKITIFGNFSSPEKIIREKSILNGGYMNRTTVKIDKASGKLATDLTPESMIIEKSYRNTHNILHYIDRNDILGNPPEDPEKNNPQYNNWEEGLISWIRKNPGFSYINEKPPKEYDDIHTEENKPKITIIKPGINQSFTKNIDIELNIESKFKIKEVSFFLNNSYLSSDFYPPYKTKIDLSNASYGNNIISVRVYDKYQNSNQASVKIIKTQ